MESRVVHQERRAGNGREHALANMLQKVVAPDPAIAFTLKFESGYSVVVGKGHPAFQLEIFNQRGLRAARSLDELRICKSYMDGDLNITGDFRRAVAVREGLRDQHFWITIWRRLQPLLIGQTKANKKWVQNHYDADHIQLFFVDHNYQTYTPGVFENEAESLETASERKHRLAFEGIGLKPGDRVLDVGFGWGSFLRYAARRGVHVTGITLSRQQLKYVQEELVEKEGLDVELIYAEFFQYQPPEQFDAIVMLGVIEELADYPGIMQRIAQWVKPGKRVYLDFMAATKDFIFPAFISKYIYQGRTSRVYLPKFIEAVTKSPFEILAVYNDRRNYYLTVNNWFERFENNQRAIREKFGERIYRMFRLYLAGNPFMLNHPSHLTTAYRVFLELPSDRQSE